MHIFCAIQSFAVLFFAIDIKNATSTLHTWTALLCFRSRWFVLNQFADFPGVILCSHYIVVKWASTASCVLVTRCIVCRRHDNSNKMNCGLTEEVKCLVDIWEDEQISQTLDTATTSAKFIKLGATNESQGLWTLCGRHKIILSIMTSDLLVPVAMRQTGCWVGCVLTANKPLRVQMESNQITSSRRSRLRWFIPQRAIVVFTHVPKQTEPKGGKKKPCCVWTSPIDPGVKAPLGPR